MRRRRCRSTSSARRLGKLASNSFPRDIAGELVEVQRDLESLLAGHRPVTFDLLFESRFWSHGTGAFRVGSDHAERNPPTEGL